ncbi:tail protein X [Desulfosporosinus sp. FKB]|uniref:tail protein X n=1 Tax=Desulfosporosinus sp. FKB TaxID=1969835 RepID=UPI000B497F7C|nr:tail protein X [Desulfosporosinus sp. FKB]
MTTYTTVLGDTWDMIAYKLSGHETWAKNLIEVNPQYAQTVLFSAGIVLNVPELSTSTDYSALPPWKQGAANAGT